MTPEQITAGARTVAHLAAYFGELKQTVGRMLEQSQVGRRGHFTPSEEDAVRQLQASYWQSRAALFEVALSFHDDTELPEPLRDDAFLAAYASALLLVDAARFLREAFEPYPLARQKLNEPAPRFGIPGGMYDRVQKSLTSPRHAWHLYHAIQYYDEHKEQLQARATDPLMAPVCSVIERLEERIRVSASRYVKARLRVRAHRLIAGLRHRLFKRALYGIQKLASSLAADVSTRPGHQPQLPESVVDGLHGLLRPGDILVTRKQYAVTNYFLPGFWKHVALYLGEPESLQALGIAEHENVRPRWAQLSAADGPHPQRVLESMKDGVWIRPTSSPFTADAIAALRPRLPDAQIAAALARGMVHESKPYDFDFDFTRADRLVCTEVVYRSYEGIGGVEFQLTRRAGRLTLSAEDLIGMALNRSHFEPLAVFAPAHKPQLVTGQEAEALLEQTHESDNN